MSVQRPRDGRGWRGIVRDGRRYVSSKTFPTKREALAYVAAERAKLAGGSGTVIVPGAARRRLVDVLSEFFAYRSGMVAATTAATERYLLGKSSPEWLLRRSVGSITASDVERVLSEMIAGGAAYASMRRYRDALRAFFTWAVRSGFRADNPVTGAVLPRRTEPVEEMRPFTAEELAGRFEVWSALHPVAAEVARFLGLTGLRWSEARALRISDVSLVPYPSVLVQRSRPEGVEVKTTKSGKTRRVPLAEPVVPFVRSRMAGRGPDDPLMPPLHRGRFTRQLRWSETAGGRTIHDLRHTAICVWIASGIDLATVRAWAGHGDLSITSRYVHYLGGDADRASLARLNAQLQPEAGAGAAQTEAGA